MASQLLAILQQGITSQEKHQDRELQRALRQLELGTQVKMQQQKLDFEELEGERERGFTLTRDYLDDLESQLARDIDHEREMDRLKYETDAEFELSKAEMTFEEKLEIFAQKQQTLREMDRLKYETEAEFKLAEREMVFDKELEIFAQEQQTLRDKSAHRQQIERVVLEAGLNEAAREAQERVAQRARVEESFTENINTLLEASDNAIHGAIQMMTGNVHFNNLGEEADSYLDSYRELAEEMGADSTLADKLFANIVNYTRDPVAGKAGMESLMHQINELYSMSAVNAKTPTAAGDKAQKNINFLIAVGVIPPGVQEQVPGQVTKTYTEYDKEQGVIPDGKKVGDEYEVTVDLGIYQKLEAWEIIYDAFVQNKAVQRNLTNEFNESVASIQLNENGEPITDPGEAWKKRWLFQTETSRVDADLSDLQPKLEAQRRNIEAINNLLNNNLRGAAKSFNEVAALDTKADTLDTIIRDKTYGPFSDARNDSGFMTVLLTAVRDYNREKLKAEGMTDGYIRLHETQFYNMSIGLGKAGKGMRGPGHLDVREKGGNWVQQYFDPNSKWGKILRDDKFWSHFDNTLRRFGSEKGQGDYSYYVGSSGFRGVDWWDWSSDAYLKNKVRNSYIIAANFQKQFLSNLPLYDRWMKNVEASDVAFDEVFK